MKNEAPDPRLHALVEGIVRIAGGDLSTRIPHSGARDDVAAVIAGINLMANGAWVREAAAAYAEKQAMKQAEKESAA